MRFNVMMRSRLRCGKCGHVSDKLDMDHCVRLPMPRDGLMTLEELWRGFFACELLESKCPRSGGGGSTRCNGARQKQLFLEEEPAVLVVVLIRQYQVMNRGRWRTRKSRCLVEFPERLRWGGGPLSAWQEAQRV